MDYFVGRVEKVRDGAVTYFIFAYDPDRDMYRIDFGPYDSRRDAEGALARLTA